MSMDGEPASPLQIVNAHMAKESNAYMRDYVMDDETGSLKELHFSKNSSKIIRIPSMQSIKKFLLFFENEESM